MTPTEQDDELREAITKLQVEFLKKCGMDNLIPHIIDTDDNAGQAMRDGLMQLITADRKRVELGARLDELNNVRDMDLSLVSHHRVIDRIAQLKAQQEEV